jgi:hypothetical protein
MQRRDLRRTALLLFALTVSAAGLGTACRDAGASAIQPIAFPHARHTENQIDCAFCHEYADRQASAGLPRTELCGSCHSAMSQDSPETQKLMEYVDKGEEIPWVRLYKLPQYSYFPHKWHVRAGLECKECHGDIGETTVAVRRVDLQMSWCISCHEKKGAPVDCVTCHK